MYNAAATRQRSIIYNHPHYSSYSPNHSCYLVFSFVFFFCFLCFHILRNSSASKWISSSSSSSGFTGFYLFPFFLSFFFFLLLFFFQPLLALSPSYGFNPFLFFLSYLFDLLHSLYLYSSVILCLFKINSHLLIRFFSKLPFIYLFFFDCMPHSFVVSLGKIARIFKFVLAVSEKSLAFFGRSFPSSYFFFRFSYIFLILCTLYFPAFRTFPLLTSSILYLPHIFSFNYFLTLF